MSSDDKLVRDLLSLDWDDYMVEHIIKKFHEVTEEKPMIPGTPDARRRPYSEYRTARGRANQLIALGWQPPKEPSAKEGRE